VKRLKRNYRILSMGTLPKPDIEKNELYIERNGKRFCVTLGEVLDVYFSVCVENVE
jgi:hypothetical protein